MYKMFICEEVFLLMNHKMLKLLTGFSALAVTGLLSLVPVSVSKAAEMPSASPSAEPSAVPSATYTNTFQLLVEEYDEHDDPTSTDPTRTSYTQCTLNWSFLGIDQVTRISIDADEIEFIISSVDGTQFFWIDAIELETDDSNSWFNLISGTMSYNFIYNGGVYSGSTGVSPSPSDAHVAYISWEQIYCQAPSALPSEEPSVSPSPSEDPEIPASASPSTVPSGVPASPSEVPASPSGVPASPSGVPASASPSASVVPSAQPSSSPSVVPSTTPSTVPSTEPSAAPSATPSVAPSASPSTEPSTKPSEVPSATPSATPSTEPSNEPSATPSVEPSTTPSEEPSLPPEDDDDPAVKEFYENINNTVNEIENAISDINTVIDENGKEVIEPKVIEYKCNTAISARIISAMTKAKNVTLLYTFEYDGIIFRAVITPEQAALIFNEKTKWYGPCYIAENFPTVPIGFAE